MRGKCSWAPGIPVRCSSLSFLATVIAFVSAGHFVVHGRTVGSDDEAPEVPLGLPPALWTELTRIRSSAGGLGLLGPRFHTLSDLLDSFKAKVQKDKERLKVMQTLPRDAIVVVDQDLGRDDLLIKDGLSGGTQWETSFAIGDIPQLDETDKAIIKESGLFPNNAPNSELVAADNEPAGQFPLMASASARQSSPPKQDLPEQSQAEEQIDESQKSGPWWRVY